MSVLDEQQTWERWREWISGPIFSDVTTAMARRQVWEAFNSLRQREDVDIEKLTRWNAGVFTSWADSNYLDLACVAVRRLTDTRRDVISVARLLQDMADHPQVFTRQRFISVIPNMAWARTTHFDDWADGATDCLDPNVQRRDLDGLLSAAEPIRTWVNKNIAHWDQDKERFEFEGFSIGDLRTVFDDAFRLVNRYSEALTGITIAFPVRIHDWTEAFRHPWIESGAGTDGP